LDCSLTFCVLSPRKEIFEMNKIQFETLDEVFECYGRENLIPIDYLPQIIFYTKFGCQPKFVFENEKKEGRLTCWFLKNESNFIHKKWLNANQPQTDKA